MRHGDHCSKVQTSNLKVQSKSEVQPADSRADATVRTCGLARSTLSARPGCSDRSSIARIINAVLQTYFELSSSKFELGIYTVWYPSRARMRSPGLGFF